MYGGQQGFQQAQWPQGFNHGPGYTGPPPAKKAKGNPIITRYPPPPGYRGPAVPRAPYQQQPQAQTWQYPQQPHGYGQPAYPTYTPQSYGQPQPYPQQQQQHFLSHQASFPQQPQHPQPGFQPSGQQPGVHHSATFPQSTPSQYPQPGFQASAQHPGWHHSATFPHSAPPQKWQPPASFPQSGFPPQWPPANTNPTNRRHNSAPFSTSQPNYAEAFSDNDSYVSLQPSSKISEADDLEDDYFSECYFASHPDEVNPDLSLGFITWNAPLPTKRPLPATFSEAELEAIAPRKVLPTDNEAISDYFIYAKRHDALLSVRQTEGWEELRDSLIFQEFPAVCPTTLSMSELLERYKSRHTSEWTVHERTPTPEPEVDDESQDAVGGAANTNGDDPSHDNFQSGNASEQPDMLGNLEHALQTNGTSQRPRHSRQASNTSSSAKPLSRPRPLLPVRDQDQESILAALGVTGSPKLVYETPGPAIGAPQTQGHTSFSQHNRTNSTPNPPGARQVPPPPPPPPGAPPQHHRSTSYGEYGYSNGYNGSRRSSNASQRTANGSDFDGDQDKTPRAIANGTESRKRAFEDTDGGDLASISEQDEDATPRQRYKHPRVDDAFRRRW